MGATGGATFAYRPVTNLFYRAVFASAPDLGAATSDPTRVVVRQVAILRPTAHGLTPELVVGTAVTFTTTVRPRWPELAPAVVQYTVHQQIAGIWTEVLNRTMTADDAGRATLTLAFEEAATYLLRSRALPKPFNANSVTSPRVIRIGARISFR